MATESQVREELDKAIAEGKVNRAAALREMLGIQAPTPPNTDPQLQVDSGFQEFGNVMSGLPGNAMTGLAEMGSAVGRSMAQGMDFLTSPLQGIDNATGNRLPTFEGGYESISEMAGSPTGGYMQPGMARDVIRGYGGAAPATLGMAPVAGRNLATPVGAALDFMGLGAAKAQPAVAPLAFGADQLADIPTTARLSDVIPVGQKKQEIGRLLAEGSDDTARAGYKLDPYTGRAASDKYAQESIRQGLDEGFVAMVQGSTAETKSKLKGMLDAVTGGRANRIAASKRRPLDIAGESMLDRVDTVKEINRSAGSRLDDVADTLRGQEIDVSPAVDQFIADMERMGVEFGANEGISLGFKRSDIEGLKGPISTLKKMVERMSGPEIPDARDVHALKRYIDEIVTYGKSKKGLGGRTENIIKTLRRNLDGILDRQFPQYDKVNTEYSETVEALNELQGLVGKKNDLFDEHGGRVVGTLLRRIESNAQSGPQVLRSVEGMDSLAKKYSVPGTDLVPYNGKLSDPGRMIPDFNDDIRTQVLFADELNRLFGTPAGTSFHGEITKAVDKMAEDTMTGRGIGGMLAGGTKYAVDKLRGVNEENSLQALIKLLEQN